MLIPKRVYVSVPNNGRLPGEQLDIKRAIYEKLQSVGLEPQELKVTGDLAELPWSFENVQYKLGRCHGAMVLGFVRWDVWNDGAKYKFVTAYNHLEGALALANETPTFILMHEDVHKSGIALKGRARYFVRLPDQVDAAWLKSSLFTSTFDAWVEEVRSRRPVFLGYTSNSKPNADQIKGLLDEMGVPVLEQVIDANFTGEELQRVCRSTLGGLFLFSKGNRDGELIRENLILSTGYFLHAKGKNRIRIVQEEGAAVPAGLSGQPCLPPWNQESIASFKNDLEKFITENL